jgi:hypothetical protein
MYRLIGGNNRVNYGCIDEPIDFNYRDFRLLDFFDREILGLRKKFALHSFNYIGLSTGKYLIGIAAVQLNFGANIFSYLFDYQKGKLYEFNANMLPGKLKFPLNPDEHEIGYSGKKADLKISKSHAVGTLEFAADFENILQVGGLFDFSLKKNHPLRVLNPSCGDPHRFTFTEKCSPLFPQQVEARYRGEILQINKDNCVLLYDWSGGYFNRNTNWYWAACAGGNRKNSLGVNFAALANETYFSENVFWINSRRTRVQRVIFDFDQMNPHGRDWKIWSEDGRVDLTFHPMGVRSDKKNLGFIKMNFQQFIGSFNGKLKPAGGKAVAVKDIHGVTESHLSAW